VKVIAASEGVCHSEWANPIRRSSHRAMNIQPSETQLIGKWLSLQGQPVLDEVCRRINELVTSHLKELARDSSGWDALYRDPDDGRL
jgi:hypothetical protein